MLFPILACTTKKKRETKLKNHRCRYKTGDTGLISLTIPQPSKTTLPPLQPPLQLPPIHGNLQPLKTNLNLSPLLNTLPPPPDRLPPLTFRPEILKPKMPELKPIALFSPRPARLTPLKRRHYVQHTPRPENPEPTTSNSAAITSLNTPSPVEQYSPVHFPLIQISPEFWMIPT